MAKQCADCGNSLSDDATSCEQCGGTVPADGPPAPTPAAPPDQPPPDQPPAAPQSPPQSSPPAQAPSPQDFPEDVDGPTTNGGRVSTARPTSGAKRATTFELSQLPLLNSPKRLVIAAVLVVVLVVAVLGAHLVVQRTVYTPEEAVTQFFQSLQQRDANTASSYLRENGGLSLFWSPPTASLASNQVLRSKEYKPPTDVRVLGVEDTDDGDVKFVRVSYRVTGEKFTSTLKLTLTTERHGLYFREWKIDRYHENGALGEIYIKATYPRIDVNGVALSAKEHQGSRKGVPEPSLRVSAYPGGYRATIPDNPLLSATPQYVGTVANDEYVSVEIPLSLKESGKEEIRRQVNRRIDNCVKDADLVPKDGERFCPFRSLGSVGGPDDNQRDITWSVKKYPKVRIFHEPTFLNSGVQVRANEWGDEAGVVRLSYTADDPFETKPKKVTTEVMFGIDARAEVVNGNTVLQDG